jgi:hypothetical protein
LEVDSAVGPALRLVGVPRAGSATGLRKLLGPSHELMPYVPWIEARTAAATRTAARRGRRALGTYDARDWAAGLRKPAGGR